MFTSYEIAEWRAYEQAFGPINGHWQNETLAQIHELMQTMAHMAGARYDENPVPVPRTKDRPGTAYGFERDANGMCTVVPQEVIEVVEEEASGGGFDALDSFFTAQENQEG